MGETITLPGLNGEDRVPAYRARPEGRPRGAIVLIPEVFGLNRGIRARADQLATTGYDVIAPEIFWRVAPGKQLDPDLPGQLEEAIGDMQKYDVATGIGDLEATIRHARDLVGGRKVGVVGYCFGGLLAYLCATRTDADASVGYYGGGIDAYLGEAHGIANPLLLHFAEQDGLIPAEAREKIHAALDASPHVTIHDYAHVDHGFATSFGSRRDDAAATLADSRTEAFFAEHIG